MVTLVTYAIARTPASFELVNARIANTPNALASKLGTTLVVSILGNVTFDLC